MEGVDRLSLSGAIHSMEEHDDGEVGVLQAELGVEELLPQKNFPLLVLAFGDLLTKFCGFEHIPFRLGRTPSLKARGKMAPPSPAPSGRRAEKNEPGQKARLFPILVNYCLLIFRARDFDTPGSTQGSGGYVSLLVLDTPLAVSDLVERAGGGLPHRRPG